MTSSDLLYYVHHADWCSSGQENGQLYPEPHVDHPRVGESLAKDGRATTFTPEEITRFNADKKYFLEYRKLIQNTGSASFSLYYKGSELQQQAFVKFANLMEERLGHDDEMCQKLIPKFPVGCKR